MPPQAHTEEPAPSPQEVLAGRRAALRKSGRDMVLSMGVIVAIVGLAYALVPRVSSIPRAQVDLPQVLTAARIALPFEPSAPVGLPAGWVVQSASAQRDTDGVMTWHLGYITPSGHFAGIQQAMNATPAWEGAQVTDGREQGTHPIGGRNWIIRSRSDRGITSWVLRNGNRTTVVTGTSSDAELDQLALSLQPAP